MSLVRKRPIGSEIGIPGDFHISTAIHKKKKKQKEKGLLLLP